MSERPWNPSDSAPGLVNIFCIANIAFKAKNDIIALAVGLHYNVFGIVMHIIIVPGWEIQVQYWLDCGLFAHV